MSLPSFPKNENTPSREEVINQIISSIAMEELGLSHIINAEGEKIQYALGTIEGVTGPEGPLTMEELLKLNDSVHKTLDSTVMNQFLLKDKLQSALSASIMQGPTGPAGPRGPVSITVDEEADSLDPGTPPYVRNTGTEDDLELRFGIPRGATGEQGPTGPTGAAGTTILDSFDSYVEFITKHPSGTIGDAYLVEGDLYVWTGEPPQWKNMGSLVGPAGAGIEILNSYATLAELNAAHPSGQPGEVYAVKGVLHFWNEKTSAWEPIENLHGPTGPTGPEASSFTIIPFASQGAPYVGADIGGKSTNVALIGFGYMMGTTAAEVAVAVPIDTNDGHFDLTPTTNRQLAFSVPFDMKLNSIYATVGNWGPFSFANPGSKVFPYVQVYAAEAGTNSFFPLEDAFARPDEGLDALSAPASTMRQAERKGLDLELPAGTRIAIGGLMEITGEILPKDYYLYFTGGIGLTRWVR